MTWDEAQHNHLRISKWTNYFWVYDRYLAPWRNKPVKMLEIGVQQGGSLELWRRYLGDQATIVGIDHEPRFAFKAPGIHVRIGDATDRDFLQTVLDEFGPFDIVLDDGSKIQDEVMVAWAFLYPRLTTNGVYICEDAYMSFISQAHSQNIGGNQDQPPFLNVAYQVAKELSYDSVEAWSGENVFKDQSEFSFMTRAVTFYDSMVVFERGILPQNQQWEFGQLRAPA